MGFCGYVNNKNITNDENISNMLSTLTNNSKDNCCIYTKNTVALAGTPFTLTIDNTTYTIVYNGEVYNLEEIKSDLLEKNYKFLSNNEAEIILLAYIAYGKDMLEKLNGVFSFAIYCKDKDTIFLARDRLGIKPLYIYNKDLFIFSTEIKAILKHSNVKSAIGKDEICEIFGLGPAHTPGKTFFKDIFEILPGHFATYTKGILTTTCYWDLKTFEVTDSLEDSILNVKKLVTDSLKSQIKSNEPIATMLSGGLDSSVLSYLANNEIKDLHTFSINYKDNDKDFKESSYQPTKDSDFVKIMQEFLDTKHTEIEITSEELYNALKESMIARDMPGMADVDSAMLVFCKKIYEHGFSTVISGECSDEIFGGYPWYYKEELLNTNTFPWARSTIIRSKILNKNIVNENYLKNYIEQSYIDVAKKVIYNSNDMFENTFRKTCYTTIKWFMNTLIERTERMSTLSNLNVRVPFADYRIFEYVYNVCAKFKLGLIDTNHPQEKYLLRKAFDTDLPNSVLYRKKSPFPKTYDPKYLEFLENDIIKIINKSTSPILELIDVNYLYELLETHGKNLKENWFGQLMTYPQTLAYLIQINMWLEEYNIEILI